MNRDHLAELYALDEFDWIVEDGADEARIIADTYRAYAAEIAKMKMWVYTDLRSQARIATDAMTGIATLKAALQKQDRTLSWLARHIGISRAGVHAWKRVPLRWTAAVSELTGVSEWQLLKDTRRRPDDEGRPAVLVTPEGFARAA